MDDEADNRIVNCPVCNKWMGKDCFANTCSKDE